jgi:signal transduction histidine kinase
MVGKRFAISPNLKMALAGTMVAKFNRLDESQDTKERASGKPLLEIYNPVLQPWSGKVVAVAEFYEVAEGFQHSLQEARIRSWVAVATFTLAFFLILSAIVFRGSRTIESQRSALKQRIGELSALLEQNEALRSHVQRASQRATATNESYLRRFGADLHDGPAQLIAYAALRIDSDVLVNPKTSAKLRRAELSSIKSSLDDAMAEIRSICSGLVLPQIEAASLTEILDRVVQAHQQRTGTTVSLFNLNQPPSLTPSGKICVYRFVQEALNNAFHHGGGLAQEVKAVANGQYVAIEVSDKGEGFDPDELRPSSLGLAGLRERVESLGGAFEIRTSCHGTRVRMSLGALELEEA